VQHVRAAVDRRRQRVSVVAGRVVITAVVDRPVETGYLPCGRRGAVVDRCGEPGVVGVDALLEGDELLVGGDETDVPDVDAVGGRRVDVRSVGGPGVGQGGGGERDLDAGLGLPGDGRVGDVLAIDRPVGTARCRATR
jgi:hypothetical protein